MPKIEVNMIQTRITRGAVMFTELDDKGEPIADIASPGCRIGSLYLRKTNFSATEPLPTYINVVVEPNRTMET